MRNRLTVLDAASGDHRRGSSHAIARSRPLRSAVSLAEITALTLGILNVPVVSTAALFAVVLFEAITWLRTGRLGPTLAIRMGILATFLLAYYLITELHGFYDPSTAVKYALLVAGLYGAGHRIASTDRGETIVWASFGIIVAMSGYALASTLAATGASIVPIDVTERAVPGLWVSSELVKATGIGALSSAGMCLLPIAFFGDREGTRWTGRLLRLSVVALAGGGLYVNAALQNRTPFMALAFSTAGASILWIRQHRVGRLSRGIGVVLGLAAAVAAWTLVTDPSLVGDLALFRRFDEEGLHTTRYAGWVLMLKQFTLVGGRRADLGGLLYAHNLWLDVAYDAGVFAFALLLTFHALHVRPLWLFIRSGAPLTLRMSVLAVATSVVTTYMAEPVMAFSMTYFAGTCFLLGALIRLSPRKQATGLGLTVGRLANSP